MMVTGLCVSAAAGTELIVFAAASMTETLTEIKALYEEADPETQETAVQTGRKNILCRFYYIL